MAPNLNVSKSATDRAITFVLLLFVGCVFLSSLIPPLKSPDEIDHIERAYLFGKGVIVLSRIEGAPSGGYVDSGLLQYLRNNDQFHVKKLSIENIASSRAIRWSHQRVYDPSPGTGYYFPVVYLPQTMGLLIGEWLDLTVDRSYRLARTIALSAAAALLLISFKIFTPNPLVLALLVIPMTLFQFSSASLDGITIALSIFVIAAFLRISRDKRSTPRWLLCALTLAMTVLATSRVHTLPMLILLVAAYVQTRDRKFLIWISASIVFIFWWNLVAIITTVDQRIQIGDTTTNLMLFYARHPFRFFTVVWSTLSDATLRAFYYKSFIGILGWLDASFHESYYTFFLAMICLMMALSVSLQCLREEWPQRLLLLVVSFMSLFFVFYALLITWSPHPASVISGVQGRYFLIPSILFAYSLSGGIDLFERPRGTIAFVLVLCLFIVSVYASASLMIMRYYLVSYDFLFHAVLT